MCLAVSTFPDGLQGPTRTRKMGQNVLTKQSASRLVSAHVWTSLMKIHVKSGACANSGYQFLSPPREKARLIAPGTHDRTMIAHPFFTASGT